MTQLIDQAAESEVVLNGWRPGGMLLRLQQYLRSIW